MTCTTAQPERPREPVKVGGLTSTGSAAAPTIESRPLDQVQTGGFGDPHGLAGAERSQQARQHRTHWLARSSSGPGLRQRHRRSQWRSRHGSQHGFRQRRGYTAHRPFRPARRSEGRRFCGGRCDEAEAPKPKQAESTAAVQPVVILEKPNPIYTDEARKLGLEGEVLVEVVFPASGGPVQVVRVMKGLGHGLDEAAMRAARADSLQAGFARRQAGGFSRHRSHRIPTRVLESSEAHMRILKNLVGWSWPWAAMPLVRRHSSRSQTRLDQVVDR